MATKEMKKVAVKVTKIDWDAGLVRLPKRMRIPLEDLNLDVETATRDEIEEAVSDALSDVTGFCHNGFKWEWELKRMTKADKLEAIQNEIRLQVAKMCAEAVDQGDADMVGQCYWQELDLLLDKLTK